MFSKERLKRNLPNAWSVERWSCAYLRARLAQVWFRVTHPDCPWLTRESVAILNEWLKPGHAVIEFGSGGSTVFFAARCERVISYEHDVAWNRKVHARLARRGFRHVETHRFEVDDPRYWNSVCSLPDESVDLVLIDGRRRAECAWNALPKIKPGGLLVIDNADRYMVHGCSDADPAGARLQARSSSGELWNDIARHTADWEPRWTDNGVFVTLILQRP